MNRQTRLFVAAFLSLLAVSHWGFAQGSGASLSGVIKDTAGAPIPGATVIVRNSGTSQTREAVSDEQGRYAFLSMDLGQHELTAQKQGFKPARFAVELSVSQQAETDITLAPGEVNEGVEVKGGEQLAVETRSSTFGQLVTRGQIENLPLNGRDFSQLILLQPGTTQARSDQGDILSGKGAKISVLGARTSQNAYMLDGADILDALGRNAASAQGLVSGIESVQEFAVLTNTYNAEYGRAAGGVFNIATRSGTNQFHGTVFEFLRNSALDAANFFENANGQQKAPFKRNQFGASGGGPIIKNKAFFFGAYEGFRERLGLTVVEDVPSLAARRGAFLPAGRSVSPEVGPYLQLIPPPTIDDPNREKAKYIGQFNQPSNLDTYNLRVDYNFSKDDSLFARYTHNDSEITFLNPETFPGFPNRGSNNQKFFTIGETHVFSGALVNNIRYAFNRTSPDESPAPPNGFKDLAFIPGDLVGTIFISGFKRFGTDRNTPRSFLQNTNQLSDDLSFIKGAHLMKAGMNVEYFRISGNSASRNRGEFTINTFSDFLQGRSRDFVGLAPGQDDTIRHHRQWLFGFYFQDDWKARPNLTLNLGLRYEFITVPTEIDGKMTNVRKPADREVSVGDPLFENPSMKNFSPRVGFAYGPDFKSGLLGKLTGGQGKTSIRGGFGVFSDQLLYSVYGNMTFKHPPFFKQVRIANAPFPNVYPMLASGRGLVDTFAIDFNPSPTYAMQYNLNIQREVSSKLVVTAAYVGSRGIHLWREADFNNAIPLTPDGTRFPPVAPSAAQRRNPNFANIRYKVSDAQSFYNAFQSSVISRLSRDFQAQLSYTLAKSVDDQSSSLGRNEFANGQARMVDPYNKKLNRGLSDFDVRNNLSFSFIYELPFGPGRAWGGNAKGMARVLIEGWQFNGVFQASSGIPVSPIFTFDQNRDATTDNEQRPNLKSGVTKIPKASRLQLFDPFVFELPAVGSRCTLGRNVVIGPGVVSFDPSLVKFFYLNSDRTRSAQFRAEFFNVFNHANFAIPTIGKLTVFNSPTERNTTAGEITQTSAPSRQIQFAVRIAF